LIAKTAISFESDQHSDVWRFGRFPGCPTASLHRSRRASRPPPCCSGYGATAAGKRTSSRRTVNASGHQELASEDLKQLRGDLNPEFFFSLFFNLLFPLRGRGRTNDRLRYRARYP